MPRSFFRKFGFARRDESSSDSEEEVRNEFNAASVESPSSNSQLHPNQRPPSVFSRQALSSCTESTRSTRFTEGTADTSNSLRSEASKRQRLHVVDVDSGSSQRAQGVPQSFDELVASLQTLASKMESLDNQTNLDSAPRISATLARLINDYTATFKGITIIFDSDDLPDLLLTTILRIVLGYTDVYLVGQANRGSRAHLLRALYHFAESLHLLHCQSSSNEFGNSLVCGDGSSLDGTTDFFSASMLMDGNAITIPQPRLFAIGSSPRPVPNEDVLSAVLETFVSGSATVVDQEGAYAAPCLCGLSPRFSVATLCLGIPEMQQQHFESIVALKSDLKSLHVFGRQDSIISAATTPMDEVKPPYRIPNDPLSPPMSMSLATSHSKFVSGTLGGFVYPKVSNDKNMDRNIYALTCGHVCLQEQDQEVSEVPTAGSKASQASDNTQESTYQPRVEYPSPVLTKMFRKALIFQRDRFDSSSPQHGVLEKAIAKVDNQVSSVLGELVWGERTVIGHQMSDTAVIKCEPTIKCQNWLGDDIELSQYDPSLILDQLRVRSVIGKSRGLEVFKYGSTSRYTTGSLSNIRIVYWASGAMQTSEFAVRSGESSSFANGGDSGAWILSSTSNGLGVLGMLHSYDGEYREFGLYTPMPTILARLHQVTGVLWGVLGVPTDTDQLQEEAERSE